MTNFKKCFFKNKRTPLHYSAALRDGGYMYKLMRKSGADPNIFDCNGRPPKYYLKYPGEINLEQMRMDTKQALKQVLHNRVAPSYLETKFAKFFFSLFKEKIFLVYNNGFVKVTLESLINLSFLVVVIY